MIVRCKECVSAFAVDDEKVADKKFAFTCPKCGTENIVDNRKTGAVKEETRPQGEESFFNDDFSVDTGSAVKEKKQAPAPDEDLFEEAPADKSEPKEEDFSEFENELATEYPAEEADVLPEKKSRNINLEIEEFEDIPGIAEDEIFSEKPSAAKKKDEDDIFADMDAVESIKEEDEIFSEAPTAKKKKDEDDIFADMDAVESIKGEDDIFSEAPPAKKKKDEDDIFAEIPAFDSEEEAAPSDTKAKGKPQADGFDIELKDDSALPEDEEIFFDDFEDTPEEPKKTKEKPPVEESINPDEEFIFDEFEETAAEDTKSEREKKLSSQDDIDALFADEGINFEEEPISKKGEMELEDEITVDLDMLDIDLEEGSEDKLKEEPAAPARQVKKQDLSDEDITLDIDTLDIDLDESSPETSVFDESAGAEKSPDKHALSDDDITLDIDNLDIDLDETSPDSDIFSEPAAAKRPESAVPEDDSEFNEEDIKLNLDDLDIDLEEIEEKELVFDEDEVKKLKPAAAVKSRPVQIEDDEDESITIDLDTLEIEIADEKNAINAEMSEDDEKLTLEDAGLTLDELTSEMKKSDIDDADEDIKLTLNDIDPSLTIEKIAPSKKSETVQRAKAVDVFPEIDLTETVLNDIDRDIAVPEASLSGKAGTRRPAASYDELPDVEFEDYESPESDEEIILHEADDDYVLFPESDLEQPSTAGRDYDIFDYEESDQEKASPKKGNTFFSIDFSLKYSRVGALLRLLGLYLLSMIPHFIVLFIYSLVSSIVGFINQIVILSTGRCVEDFALLIENTMRYYFYIETCITGIVEDRPVYTGKETIDHPLQLNITYPLKYSKNFAILRLSIIGMLLFTLPHLIIMMLLGITIPVVYLAGIISVIITRRWPNILFLYLTKYFRYTARISAFITGLTDEYPSFRFD